MARAWTRVTIKALLLIALMGQGACATSPDSQDGKALQETLWQTQRERNENSLRTAPASGRLLVLVAGLSDESKAFAGDVLGTIDSIKSIRGDLLLWSMWNPALGEKSIAPFATRDSLRRAIGEMREIARPGDRILVMFTSHGGRDQLSNVAANKPFPAIRGAELRELLLPLADWETGVVISACYSGSLIPALRHPKRWIMTAAAADRSSWGCQFQSKQTYFIESLLSSLAGPNMGLDAWYTASIQKVRAAEVAAKLTPSLPQMWVGQSAQPYRKSLATFWGATP